MLRSLADKQAGPHDEEDHGRQRERQKVKKDIF